MSDPDIKTSYWVKPIPDREYDWIARFTWFDGDDDQPVGYGETEESAVIDLLQEAGMFDDDGSTLDAVVIWRSMAGRLAL